MRVFRFLGVGAMATVTHLFVGSVALQFPIPPLTANVIAFSVALLVSFSGHFRFSFADRKPPLTRSTVRFLCVTGIGFACNQSLFALLLVYTNLGSATILLIATCVVACLSYVLFSRWAFVALAPRS